MLTMITTAAAICEPGTIIINDAAACEVCLAGTYTSAFDATNLLFDSIQRIAVLGSDGSISIPRSALIEAIRVINGYRGVSNQMVCKPTGDCAQSATIAVYRAPFWPVGPSAAISEPVFSKTETLAAVVARN